MNNHSSSNGKAVQIGSQYKNKMSIPSTSSSADSNIKKQFDAAVNVIRNLPTDAKDSPFQPSDDLKLKFYAYFKQATEGPNETPKPSFFDIVGKYKWSAWKDLGQMSKEEAMAGYVNELKKIVETMALTQPVADFYEVLGPFYEFVFSDKPNGKVGNGNAGFVSQGSSTSSQLMNGHTPVSDPDMDESEGEEFSDTYDHVTEDHRPGSQNEIISARGEAELTPSRFGLNREMSQPVSSRVQSNRSTTSSPTHGLSSLATSGSGDGRGPYQGRSGGPSDVNEQIALAVLRLQQSMDQVSGRLDSIERKLAVSKRTDPGWWPLTGIPIPTAVFLVIWPFAAQLIMNQIRERRNKK